MAVVILPTPAAILNVQNGVVPYVYHFVLERSNDLFNRPVERSTGNVDFPLSAAGCFPDVRGDAVGMGVGGTW